MSESYIAVVNGRPGDLGGGLYEFAVEFIANISLSDVVKFLAGGIAYDLIKSGSKAFVLRPFCDAYKKLKDRNPRLDITEFRVMFQDSILVIYKITDDSIFSQLESILGAIAKHYENLVLASGETPLEIHVPVLEDLAQDRLCRFRVLLDVDETIANVTTDDYFKLWGISYDFSRNFRIYDLTRELLIDEEFYTQQRYNVLWEEWYRKRKSQ